MSDFPRHFREKPPEWDGLLAMSETIGGMGLIGIQEPQALYEFIDRELGDEELDSNRFFSQGLGFCELSELLKDPAYNASIVDRAFDKLAMYILTNSHSIPDGLSLMFVSSKQLGPDGSISHVFYPPSKLAVAKVETKQPGFTLLGDTLTQLHNDRVLKNRYPSGTVQYSDSRLPYVNILEGGLLAEDMSSPSTTSITKLIFKALVLKDMQQSMMKFEEVVAWNPYIGAILGELSLGDLVLNRAKNRLAIGRLDVCGDWNKSDTATADKHGNLTYDSPDEMPPKPYDVLHEDPLICPAHTVEALIPQVMDICVKALEQTDAYLRRIHAEEYAAHHSKSSGHA